VDGIKEFAAKEKLEIVLFASASRRGGRKGGSGGIPTADLPAEVSTQAGPREFRSDIFKQTPPVGKRVFWLALAAGEPAVPGFIDFNIRGAILFSWPRKK
jgi:hypothetical protein